MQELREHARAPIELRVEYRKLNSFFADYTRNISRGGTFIRTKKPLPVGTRFLFRLALPSRPVPFELAGVVTRVEERGDVAGMGLRFAWSDAAAQAAFDRAVAELMEESLGPVAAAGLLAHARRARDGE